MAQQKKKVNSEVAFIVAIIIGLIIGKFIKKVSIGLMFGVLLFLTFLMTFSSRKRLHIAGNCILFWVTNSEAIKVTSPQSVSMISGFSGRKYNFGSAAAFLFRSDTFTTPFEISSFFIQS